MKTRRKLDAGYRVLKILLLLHKKPMDLDELCYALDTDEQGVNRETISKYFSTLRYFGCVITKSNGKFRLKHVPYALNLMDNEIETLAVFEKFGEKLCDKNNSLKIKSALNKVLQMEEQASFEKYQKTLKSVEIKDIYSKYANIMERLSKFFDTSARIFYKDRWIKVSPKYFKYSRHHIYLYALNEEKRVNELFMLDYIKEIVHLPKRHGYENFAESTTFKIKGRLALGYHLYEDEVILEETKDFKTILNKSQDKTQLIRRFIKYGEYCEIISPEKDKEKLLSALRVMIGNHSAS